MWIWIFAIVITLIGYIVYSAVKSVLDRHYAPKDPTLSTPLTEFKESAAIDNRLAISHREVIVNISEAYERMCVLEPMEYKNDPAIPGIIAQYKKLLSGELKDPEGRHVPSEFLLEERNPDYDRYINAQRGTGNKGLRRESRRLKVAIGEENLRNEFTTQLLLMKFPALVINSVLSEEKLNSYSSEDWKKLTQRVSQYCEEYSAEAVAEFLETFHDLNVLLDPEKLLSFVTFRKYSVPVNIVSEIIYGRISVEQAARILKLGVDDSYTWEEAVEEVLQEDADKNAEKELRTQYREMLRA
jgi:hypothetical protein